MNIAKLYTFKVHDRRLNNTPVKFDRRVNVDRRVAPRIPILSKVKKDVEFIKKLFRLMD